ncbi:STAG-domain-containing protein, partial [Piedraia hortae CBS 480.64]
ATMSTRRSSRRVSKPVQSYASSPVASGTKRKRNQEEAAEEESLEEENNASEEEEEATEDDDWERKKPTPKKSASKKAKTVATLPFRSTKPKGRPRKKTKQTIDEADAADAGRLYTETFSGGSSLDDIIGAWLGRFRDHESSALAEATQPTQYPLIAKSKIAATTREALTDMFATLIRALSVSEILYNESVLLENIQIWISAMSSVPNRSFRHTGTVAALGIITALCQVAKENARSISNYQRHAETEKKKKKHNTARVKELQRKAKKAGEAQEFLEPQLEDWFEVIFIHRYRDVDPAIRRDCVEALGDWIVTLPDVFFDGGHLRYLGWLLSDPSAATRGEVLRQLHRLYTDKDKLGGLKSFTEKFRSRMVEIATADAEINVRVSAIDLLNVLREDGLLEPDDIDVVGKLIYDTEARIRKAVAAFFVANVEDAYNGAIDSLGGVSLLEEELPEVDEDDFSSPRTAWLKYKFLTELLHAYDQGEELPNGVERNRDKSLILHISGGESRFSLAADALYPHLEEVQEWRHLAGYLLFDHSTRKQSDADGALLQLIRASVLTENEESILLQVLYTSIRRSFTETAERLTSTGRAKRKKERLGEDQESSVRHLTAIIPKLLKKYGDVPATASSILRIETIFSLPGLQSLPHDAGTYASLLDDVRKQFMSHGSDSVLLPASNALLHAQSQNELHDLTSEKVSSLWEEIIGDLNELLTDPKTVSVRGVSTSEELVALNNTLLRIVRLANVADCSGPFELETAAGAEGDTQGEKGCIIDTLTQLISRAKHASSTTLDAEDSLAEDNISSRAATAALLYFQWQFKAITEAMTTPGSAGIEDSKLEKLAVRRDALVETLKTTLGSVGGVRATELTGTMVEMFISAATLTAIEPLPGLMDDYIVLAGEMDDQTAGLVMKCFGAVEKRFAELAGKGLEVGEEEEEGEEDQQEGEGEEQEEEEEEEEEEDEVLKPLLAEQRLCALTGKIVFALLAGVFSQEKATKVRERVTRNKARLGANYKAVLAFLEDGVKKRVVNGGKRGRGRRDNAIPVPEEERLEVEGDEIED